MTRSKSDDAKRPDPLPPRQDDSRLMLFRASPDAFPKIEFNPEKITESVENLRRALPAKRIHPFPSENLYILNTFAKDLHYVTSQYLRCQPTKMNNSEFFTESAKLLLNHHDMEDNYNIDDIRIANLQELFDFLHEFNNEHTELLRDLLEDSLKEAFFENLCRTDEDRENLLRRALQQLGYPDAIVQLKPAFEQTAPKVLPEAAPEKYSHRADRQEKPPAFIKRVYGPWLGKGLSQADINRLDPQLYTALHNWLRHNSLPTDLDLPTKSQAVTREIEQAGPEIFREANRLHKAAYNRRKRLQKISME